MPSRIVNLELPRSCLSFQTSQNIVYFMIWILLMRFCFIWSSNIPLQCLYYIKFSLVTNNCKIYIRCFCIILTILQPLSLQFAVTWAAEKHWRAVAVVNIQLLFGVWVITTWNYRLFTCIIVLNILYNAHTPLKTSTIWD